MASKQNYQATVVFKVKQYDYEVFRNVKPVPLNHIHAFFLQATPFFNSASVLLNFFMN